MSSEYNTASEGGPSHAYVELSSDDPQDTSAEPSRPSSAGAPSSEPSLIQKKSRVRFNSTSEANDAKNQKSKFPLREPSVPPLAELHDLAKPPQAKPSSLQSRNNSTASLVRRALETDEGNPFDDPPIPTTASVLRPNLTRHNPSTFSDTFEDVTEFNEKTFSALAAQERAQRVASLVGSHSAPASRTGSIDEEIKNGTAGPSRTKQYPVRIDDIPLVDMDSKRTYDGGLDSDEETLQNGHGKPPSSSEAHNLVRAHTRKLNVDSLKGSARHPAGLVSGQVTPTHEQDGEDYVPRPGQYRGGVLSSLLKLYNAPAGGSAMQSRRGSDASTGSPSQNGSSGMTTPRTKHAKWYNHKAQSQDTLAGLIEASAILGAQGGARTPKRSRPGLGKKSQSGKLLDSAMRTIGSRPRLEDEIRITVHIAEILSRQKYLLKLCRALMSYGAPTHRLEEVSQYSGSSHAPSIWCFTGAVCS